MPEWTFLIIIGFMLIIVGFFLAAFGMMSSVEDRREDRNEETKEEKVKGGGVILIGPVPIVFGSDKRFALIAMILAIVIMLLVLLGLH